MLLFLLSVAETETEKNKITKLYEQHIRAIERVAHKLAGGNDAVAEEAMQEMWIAAIKQISKKEFENSRAERAYLYAVLQSKVYDLQRIYGQIVAHEIPEEDVDTFPDGSGGDLLELVCAAEGCKRVESIIRSMKTQDQESIIVYLRLDQSIEKTAEALGIRPEAARMRLNRARKRLAALLKEEGIIYG